MKDEKAEKYIHSLLQKSHGFDPLKSKFEATRQEFQEIKASHQQVMSQFQEAAAAYQRNDLDTVFEMFKMDPNKILQWAVHKVELSQMPPEQRQALEERRASEKHARELEKSQQTLQEQMAQEQAQHVNQMLDLVLERQDYSAVAQAYDAKKGQPGAFKNLVRFVGASEYNQTRKVLSPLDAAQKALELIGEKLQPATAPAQAQTATPAVDAPQTKPKTLPNLQNGARANVSPGKGKYKSIDDLKKQYDKIAAQN